MKKIILIPILLLFLSISGQALADTRYVDDELTITMRQGMGEQYKIIKMLKTGTSVEILEEIGNYFKARTKDGTEGYVLKQFVSAAPPKTFVIARLEKDIDRLKSKLQTMESQEGELKNQLADKGQTEKMLAEVTAQYEELKEKSDNVVQLASDRDRLESENISLSTEVQELRNENEQMFFTGMIKWFLAGGGVFFLGWVIGKVSRKKKRMY